MRIEWFSRLLVFVVLLLVQVLVLNRIHLFHVATPLLYVYLVLLSRRNASRWAVLLWSFAMGLSVDTFANTPGVASASMTLVGMLQPYVLSAFMQRDSADDLKPSMRTMGVARYVYYAAILVAVFCLVFFTLEIFSFSNWLIWLESVGGSMALTLLLILVIENLRRS